MATTKKAVKKTAVVKEPKEKKVVSLEAKIYSIKGEVAGNISLPEKIFGLSKNSDLVHQVVVSMQSNQRANTAHTKDRSEVTGTGKKPWRQKGTGRARHGDSQSPIWVGGGVAHGPKNTRNYKKKINKKMNAKALFTVLSEKFKAGRVLFVEDLNLSEIKTKQAHNIVMALSKVDGFERLEGSKKVVAHIATSEKNDTVIKSFNNIPHVELNEIRNLNILDLLNHRYLVIVNPAESIKTLEAKLK
jgi:large subunit ribosomal protein L4